MQRKDVWYNTTVAGYSKRSLREKLGLKPGSSTVFLFVPPSYIEELGELGDIQIFSIPSQNHDFIHLFTKEKQKLVSILPKLKKAIKPNGKIWISWPKLSQKVLKTDLTENIVRDIGLKAGLVDVKVVAVDEVWSSLEFVIRLCDR